MGAFRGNVVHVRSVVYALLQGSGRECRMVRRSFFNARASRGMAMSKTIELSVKHVVVGGVGASLIVFLIGWFAGYSSGRKSIATELGEALMPLAGIFTPKLLAPKLVAPKSKPKVAKFRQRVLLGKLSLLVSTPTFTRIELNDYGKSIQSENKLIQIDMVIGNTDKRKIIELDGGSTFFVASVTGTMTDDVGNRIRGVSFKEVAKIVGALKGDVSINPGKATTHVLVFSAPLENTESLNLTIKLKDIGLGSEKITSAIQYTIPMDDVRGWSN